MIAQQHQLLTTHARACTHHTNTHAQFLAERERERQRTQDLLWFGTRHSAGDLAASNGYAHVHTHVGRRVARHTDRTGARRRSCRASPGRSKRRRGKKGGIRRAEGFQPRCCCAPPEVLPLEHLSPQFPGPGIRDSQICGGRLSACNRTENAAQPRKNTDWMSWIRRFCKNRCFLGGLRRFLRFYNRSANGPNFGCL